MILCLSSYALLFSPSSLSSSAPSVILSSSLFPPLLSSPEPCSPLQKHASESSSSFEQRLHVMLHRMGVTKTPPPESSKSNQVCVCECVSVCVFVCVCVVVV